MIFRPNRKQLQDAKKQYENLIWLGVSKALEEIEDSFIEMSLGFPGFISLDEEGKLIGSLSYEIKDGILSLNHVGSLRKGQGREMMAKLESLKPLKIFLSSRQDAFEFYVKLGYLKGDRYGDFFKEEF